MYRIEIVLALFTFSLAMPSSAQVSDAGRPVLRLTLRRAIEIALSPEGNVGARLAQESVHLAEALHSRSRALRRPVIESHVSEQNLSLNPQAIGFQIETDEMSGFMLPRRVGPFSVFDARVTARYNLLDPGTKRHAEAARAQISVAEAARENRLDQVALQVARLYILGLRNNERVETARANVELSKILLSFAERQEAAGTGAVIEVTRARSQLAGDEYHLSAAQLEQEIAELRLLTEIGQPLDTRLELADSLKLDLVRSQSLDESIELAKKSRNDIRVQARRIEKERLNDRAIHSERLPSIALFADLGALNTNTDRPVATHTVGFAMRFPVFDGGRRASRRAEVQSKIRSEELRRKRIEDQLELEVRQSIRRLELSRGQVEVAELGRSLAEEELARARRRYGAGVTNSLEVVHAQARLREAQSNHIEALYAHNLSRIDFSEAKGDVSSLMQ